MLADDLDKAKLLIDEWIKYYEEFSTIYTFTTENIAGYIKYFDLKNKSLLTVGSSGDQVLNAYYEGAKDITLYDINEYSKYYTYLKIAAILSLNYKEFQQFFFIQAFGKYYNKYVFSNELFNKLKDNLKQLDYDSYMFFETIFNTYNKNKIRRNLFNDDESREEVIKGYNNYLKNEDNYNKLKSIIKSICFKYVNGNIFKDKIDGKYDNIFLSNLCTTSGINKLKELLMKLDKENININGKILIGYLWNIKYNIKYYEQYWIEVYKMPITKHELKHFISEHHSIKNSDSFLYDRSNKKDLVLIYRKK